MTKSALRVFRQLHDTLVESGVSKSGMNSAARDGYAALWLWMSGGQPVERLTLADVRPIPPMLRLDTAPLARQAAGYILPADPADWLVLARVGARETIRLDATAYAYPEPMLVWTGWRGVGRGSIVTGCVNLAHTPTVEELRLGAGKNYLAAGGAAEISQGDADDDLLMAAQCFARFYGI